MGRGIGVKGHRDDDVFDGSFHVISFNEIIVATGFSSLPRELPFRRSVASLVLARFVRQ
jgi:hypothetical protein